MSGRALLSPSRTRRIGISLGFSALAASAYGCSSDESNGGSGSGGTSAGSPNGSAGGGAVGTSGGSAGTSSGAGASSGTSTGASGGSATTGGGGGTGGTAGSDAGSGGAAGGATAGGAGGSAGSAAAGGASGAGAGGSSGAGGSAGGTFTGKPLVFVGGFGTSYPLRTYELDKVLGTLTPKGSDVDAGPNPSYMALDPSRTHLYVCNESDDAAGGLTALSIAADGKLTKLNHQTGSDRGFTFVAVSPNGKFALGASYNGGSVSVFPIKDDGSLGPEVEMLDFGAGTNGERGAEAHSVGFDPSGKYVLVPTKGRDEVQQLLLGSDGMLTANSPAFASSASHAGPRHIAVHPNGALAFVANELDSTVTPYKLSVDGKLTVGTAKSSLPAGVTVTNSGAHVEVAPNGKFVYASNRGHDSIAIFSVTADGALTLVKNEGTRGKTPRDFDIDPAGDSLVVANQDSNNLTIYKIESDGTLTAVGQPVVSPPMPSAVQYWYPR